MSKRKQSNLEVVRTEELENFEVVEDDDVIEEEETEVMKKKWSLKKKLIVAGGTVLGLVLGAVVLGSKSGSKADALMDDYQKDNFDSLPNSLDMAESDDGENKEE